MADLNPAGQAATELEIGEEDGTPVIRLAGELDMTSADGVRTAIDGVLRHAPERVVFETSGLQFMDSSGIALLLSVAQRVPDVELRAPSPIVRRLIELTGLTEMLRIVP